MSMIWQWQTCWDSPDEVTKGNASLGLLKTRRVNGPKNEAGCSFSATFPRRILRNEKGPPLGYFVGGISTRGVRKQLFWASGGR